MSVDIQEYGSDVEVAWCPGCGNFGVLNAVKKALSELELRPHQVLICTGIGQAPKLPHYMKVNTFNGLHGREVASAAAAKLAADDLVVIVHAGEGGAYGEGGNHLLHNIRRNIDMTLCVHDNHFYALTKGQASPTTPRGVVTKVDIHGVLSRPLNPLALAITQGCGFVAQGTPGENEHLAYLIRQAVEHNGFSLLNILQPCVSWDKEHQYRYYRDHCYKLEEDYDPSDASAALDLFMKPGDGIPLGVIYQAGESGQPVFNEEALKDVPHPLRDQSVDPGAVEQFFDDLR